MTELLLPIPPGEILEEEFMAPLGLSQNALARALKIPPGRISEIVRARRMISADTALRLARYFNTSPEFWMTLQTDYELRLARRASGPEIEESIVPMAS